MAELKIFGPAGAGDPAPAPADPIQYTCKFWSLLHEGGTTDIVVVPYEQVVSAARPTSPAKSESPPPTFQAATKIGAGLMDRHAVLHDTSNGMFLVLVLATRVMGDAYQQISGATQTSCAKTAPPPVPTHPACRPVSTHPSTLPA